MIFTKIVDNGKAMSITKADATITLDYDEVKELRATVSKFMNDNYFTNLFLPCRKCGNQPEYGGLYGHRTVRCRICGVVMEDVFPHTLVKKWNRYNADGKP